MKITVYTISNCPFSQQEKDYLKTNNLAYEEKNLEMNREWLTEMLTISNNFAGTPVTKIEDKNGQITVLKGFTKEEFDQVLGLTPKEEPKPVSEMSNQASTPSVSNQPTPSDQVSSSAQSTPSTQPATSDQPTQPFGTLPEDQQPTVGQNLASDFNPPVPPPPVASFSQDQTVIQEPPAPFGQDLGQVNQVDNNPNPVPIEDFSSQNLTNSFDQNTMEQPNNQTNQATPNLPKIPDFPKN